MAEHSDHVSEDEKAAYAEMERQRQDAADNDVDARPAVRELVERSDLTLREAIVLRYHFWYDMTLREIGEAFDVTPARAHQIEAAAIRKLRRANARTQGLKLHARWRVRFGLATEEGPVAFWLPRLPALRSIQPLSERYRVGEFLNG